VPKRVFITVAERSADGHAANLVRAMRTLDPSIEFHALGGDALRAAGAIVHHDTVSRAAMGLAAFKRAAEVKRLLKWTREFYSTSKPDLHICCDSWTMNVHFARLAKSFGVPVLYYISPQVWASREGRVKELAKVADAVACILPFEEKFLRDRGLNATFVGHPLFDELISVSLSPRDWGEQAGSRAPIIALPCGSRSGVARANFPRQVEVAKRIRAAIPGATFLVPTTPATHDVVMPLIADASFITAERDNFDDVIRRSQLAITVSGTATLHIAALGTPMIVVYYANPLLWQAVGRWLVKIRTYAMVNLLANDGRDEPATHIVPEHIPWNGPVDGVADEAIAMLRDPARLQSMRNAMASAVAKISAPGASVNAAKLAVTLLIPSPGTPGEG
jgi:lipid-A-disaccharide synthase